MAELTEPADHVGDSEWLRDELLTKLVPPDVADVVVSWFFDDSPVRWWPNSYSEPGEHRLEWFVHLAVEAFRKHGSVNDAWLVLLTSMVTDGVLRNATGSRLPCGRGSCDRTAECDAIVCELLPRFLSAGLDLPRALRDASPEPRRLDLLVRSDATRDVLRPQGFLDLEQLGRWDRWTSRPDSDPRGPLYWIEARGIRALGELLDVVAAQPDETAGRVADACLYAFEVFRLGSNYPHPSRDQNGTDVADALRPWCDHLAERVGTREEDVYLLSAYFNAMEGLHRASDGATPEPQRSCGAKIAGRTLGRLRRSAREQGDACGSVSTMTGRWAYSTAVAVLAETEGLGSALRSGTLLLRAIRELAVGPDLRSWREEPLVPPPERWSWLAEALSGLVHSIGAIEQRTDPELLAARTEFAKFLLARLAPIGRGPAPEQLTEPDAVWRRCCIRAVRELGVNPEGRGHRVLHEAASNDPDEQVGLAARTAYHELRRADGATGNVSPRRRLLAALWWIRQAHVLSLGVEVDSAGARRTRNREISFTKDKRTTAT